MNLEMFSSSGFGGTIGKKITSEEQLSRWVTDHKSRERMRVRSLWIDQLKNIIAYHGISDLKITEDLRFYRRLSGRQIKELDQIYVNFIQPHVRTLAAKIQKARPILECVPATSDESDVQAAKVGDRLLRSEWYQQQMDSRRIEALIWLCSTGNAFLHTYFDPRKGPLNQGVPVGEVVTDIVSPLKILVEPHRTKMKDCRWAIISEKLPKDQVVENYGDVYRQRTGKELVLNDLFSTGTNYDAVTESYLAVVGVGDTVALDDSDYCEVDTLYHLPSAQYPNGIYAVVVGQKVIHIAPFPYPFLRRLPIVHLREVCAPWRFYGETSTSEVLKIQDLYVRLRRIERDYHLDALNVFWLKKKGTRVDDDDLKSRDNRVVEYEGEVPPQRIPGTGIPGGIYNSIQLAIQELDRSTGISESTRGIAPSGVSSGRALLALQEQDETRLGLTIQMMEDEFSVWGQNVLLMAREFYVEERRYAVVGESVGGAMWQFDRTELRETYDVRCVAGSALPQNKYAKQESVMQMFQAGILGNPQSEEAQIRARRMLEFGLSEDVFDDAMVHEQVAEKENVAMISMGQQLRESNADPAMAAAAVMPVAKYDMDLVHLKCHMRRLNQAGIRDNQLLYAILSAHCDQHMQKMQPQAAQVTPEQVVNAEDGENPQALQAQAEQPQEPPAGPPPQNLQNPETYSETNSAVTRGDFTDARGDNG